MAIYAVGDVQGCASALQQLLDELAFDAAKDQLWLTGDLVNRGADSLQALRMVKGFGDSAITVLGNHDLHLLAVAAGVKSLRPGDTIKQVLQASDSDAILDWLRHRPMAHFNHPLKTLMVHAGIYPGWNLAKLQRLAVEVETALRGDNHVDFLQQMYAKQPVKWHKDLRGNERLRFIANAMTRMRFIDAKRQLDFAHKGAPGSQPGRLMPWYQHPKSGCQKWRIVCGHWSALGFIQIGRVLALDSGCVWGGALTAVRLDGRQQHWQVKCNR